MTEIYDKILGSLLGAAVGDAMGAATETRTSDMIMKDFGGYVTKIEAPPDGCFISGMPAGTVTDDFSLAYETALVLKDCKGKVTDKEAKQSLLNWSENPFYFSLAGPTTCGAVKNLKEEPIKEESILLACDNHKATNGGAMKIFPAGLINCGNLDKAVEDAITLCLPTHSCNTALSAACAIACATARALQKNASVDDIIEAGIYGARRGFERGTERGLPCAMASVEKRILLAVEIGKKYTSWEASMKALSEIIGSSIAANESIPCVFGILAASGGRPMPSITMGVNIGNDTDTIASMAGAVSGALFGTDTIPLEYIKLIDTINGYHLQNLAKELTDNYY